MTCFTESRYCDFRIAATAFKFNSVEASQERLSNKTGIIFDSHSVGILV